MIDMRHKPPHLPQMSAPFDIVVSELEREGIKYKKGLCDPDDLEPSQGFTFCDAKHIKQKPIWVGGEDDDTNAILDGHHTWVSALSSERPVEYIKVFLKPKDACRLLNKIQDIYEYKQQIRVEEIVTQSRNINDRNDPQRDKPIEDDWLSEIESLNDEVLDENKDKPKNKESVVGYRNKDINENSVIGNFFSLTPEVGYDKYEIEFDNLLNTSTLGIQFFDGQVPTDVLAKIWFPYINFEIIANKHGVDPINIKNRCITEKARKMGFDGIKYGDSLVQGIK